MRILITGATGFVGGHLCEHLLSLGDEVSGLSSTGWWPEDLARLQSQITLIKWDLTRPDDASLAAILRDLRPHAVIHLASQANPALSHKDPRGTWANNVGAAFGTLEACRVSGLPIRVVLIGSGLSYGRPSLEHIPIRESCPTRPLDPYAASKAACDLLGLQYALAHSLDVVMVRPFNHSGPRQAPRYVLSGLAKQVADVELGRTDMVRVGNLDVVRDFTDVRDVVRAYRLLCEGGTSGETYNLGSGVGLRLIDAMNHLQAIARGPIQVVADPERMRGNDASILICDPSKLREAVGWNPTIPIEQTLSDMLDYWRTDTTHT